jgi:hypothetical protein
MKLVATPILRPAARAFLGVIAAQTWGCDTSGEILDVGSDRTARGDASVVLDATTQAPAPLTVTLVGRTTDDCGACVELTARPEGGTAPYTFEWSPPASGDGGDAVVCPAALTTYTVTVIDSSGTAGELPTTSMSATAALTVGAGLPCPKDEAGIDGGDAGIRVFWADWQSQDGGTVFGTISLPTSTIRVTYAGVVSGLQTSTGTNYFLPVSTFTGAMVPNPPPGPGVIEVAGTATSPDTVTFSRPVTNPLVAIYNLGTAFANQSSSIVFDVPFTVLSTGPNTGGTGYWGSELLVPVEGGVSGIGSNGVVELQGTFTTIQWTNPADIAYASFTGLTVGVRAPGP